MLWVIVILIRSIFITNMNVADRKLPPGKILIGKNTRDLEPEQKFKMRCVRKPEGAAKMKVVFKFIAICPYNSQNCFLPSRKKAVSFCPTQPRKIIAGRCSLCTV